VCFVNVMVIVFKTVKLWPKERFGLRCRSLPIDASSLLTAVIILTLVVGEARYSGQGVRGDIIGLFVWKRKQLVGQVR